MWEKHLNVWIVNYSDSVCVLDLNIHYYELEFHLKSSYGKSQMSTELSIYHHMCSSDFHFPLFAKHWWGIKTKTIDSAYLHP